MGVIRSLSEYDTSHGSPFDRGSADSYYGRWRSPHKGGSGGAMGWDKISALADYFEEKIAQASETSESTDDCYDWHNTVYSGSRFRRAHIEIVDKRDSHGIYILHTTIFPHTHNPAPIWGFDAVCGKNKITGAFHDFSWAGGCEEMESWFAQRVKDLEWNRPRELPEWARQIFSPSMVAAGNVQEGAELDSLVQLAQDSLDYYLDTVYRTNWQNMYTARHQNNYCHWQKQNPHVVRSMVAMGTEEAKIRKFVDEILFPEIG